MRRYACSTPAIEVDCDLQAAAGEVQRAKHVRLVWQRHAQAVDAAQCLLAQHAPEPAEDLLELALGLAQALKLFLADEIRGVPGSVAMHELEDAVAERVAERQGGWGGPADSSPGEDR